MVFCDVKKSANNFLFKVNLMFLVHEHVESNSEYITATREQVIQVASCDYFLIKQKMNPHLPVIQVIYSAPCRTT